VDPISIITAAASLTSPGLLLGWIVPAALTIGVFGLFVLPSLRDITLFDLVATADVKTKIILLILTSIFLGLALAGMQTTLYRALEGYIWPSRLRSRQLNKHLHRKHELAEFQRRTSGIERALAKEREGRYPIDDTQIAPTAFGNSIRVLEVYAWQQFKMDSQLLWKELLAVVPSQLSSSMTSARTAVDFFVSLTYLSLLLAGTTAVASLAGHASIALAIIIAISIILSFLWYHLAVASCDQWREAMKAVVHLGRKPLAEALGYEFPTDLRREREMWRRINWLVREPYDDRLAPLLIEFSPAAREQS
jgi:hypothetical protein